MEAAIDIYAKLIIAFISFTAPVIVFLLSIFSDGISIAKKKSNEKEVQFGKLISGMESIKISEVEKNIKELKKEEKKNTRTLNLLNPKKQIIRIFLMLSISLISLAAHLFIKDHSLQLYNQGLSISLICLSLVAFVIAIMFLKWVAWEAIDTKYKIVTDSSSDIGTDSGVQQ